MNAERAEFLSTVCLLGTSTVSVLFWHNSSDLSPLLRDQLRWQVSFLGLPRGIAPEGTGEDKL